MMFLQNAHAYVTGAFYMEIDVKNGHKVKKTPRIAFSGIRPNCVSMTEEAHNSVYCT